MPRPIAPLDLAFLWLDRPDTPANVGALLLFDPPPRRTAAGMARQVVSAYRKSHPSPPFDCIPDLPVIGLLERAGLRERARDPIEHAAGHRDLAAAVR